MKNHLTTILLVLGVLSLTACQQRRPNEVPADWLANQDTAESKTESDSDEDLTPPSAALGETVDHIFTAQSDGLEKADHESMEPAQLSPTAQRWHLTAFMADLSVSVSGLIGSLVSRGTPSVVAVFRKQYPKVSPSPQPNQSEAVQIATSMSNDELVQAMEPSIQATLATGRVDDENQFRQEAMKSAREFRSMSAALEAMDEHLPWKVSRFRLDLTVDEMGRITPIINVGADIRLRLEWFRMKRPSRQALERANPKNELAVGLAQFAAGISEDLIELSDDSVLVDSGFKPYSYRVGLGISKRHQFGVVTDNRSLVAHLYFTRNVAKPVVNPRLTQDSGGSELALIHQGEEVTAITHKRFRKGLRRAMKMGGFFARHANRHPHAHWKVYELKTGFDLSLTGKTSLAGINGIGATEISFYNQRF